MQPSRMEKSLETAANSAPGPITEDSTPPPALPTNVRPLRIINMTGLLENLRVKITEARSQPRAHGMQDLIDNQEFVRSDDGASLPSRLLRPFSKDDHANSWVAVDHPKTSSDGPSPEGLRWMVEARATYYPRSLTCISWVSLSSYRE